MGEPVAPDAFYFDQKTGKVGLFKNGAFLMPQEAYVETSYQKRKGKKSVLRAPLIPRHLYVNPNRMLSTFDILYAIDTNHQVVDGNPISVTGIVLGTKTRIIVPGKTSVQFAPVHCLEFRGIKEKFENIAWMKFAEILLFQSFYRPSIRIGFIVDSDLGNHDDFNERRKPIYGNFWLPKNITLIYASTDAGKENIPNQMLALADSKSKSLMKRILAERSNENLYPMADKPYTHFRIWHYNK